MKESLNYCQKMSIILPFIGIIFPLIAVIHRAVFRKYRQYADKAEQE